VSTSTEDRGYVRQRIARVFATRSILPHHALIYRLCEVGPRRFDPAEIEPLLEEFKGDSRLIAETAARIYGDPTAAPQALASGTEVALDFLKRLATMNWPDLLRALGDAASKTMVDATTSLDGTAEVRATITENSPHLGAATTVNLGANLHVPRPSLTVRVSGSTGPALLLWVSHELPWIEPTDSRFWAHAARCSTEGAHALLLARTISPATFVLCKALGLAGVQYYAQLAPSEESSNRGPSELALEAIAEAVGWPHIMRRDAIPHHALHERLTTLVVRRNTRHADPFPPDAHASSAVSDALALGFDSPPGPTARALLGWSEASRLQLPTPWIDAITRRAAAERRVRRRGTSVSSLASTSNTAVAPTDGTDGSNSTRPHDSSEPLITEVNRHRIAVEVDRATWELAKQRLAAQKRPPKM
jgi:hypothetical protein